MMGPQYTHAGERHPFPHTGPGRSQVCASSMKTEDTSSGARPAESPQGTWLGLRGRPAWGRPLSSQSQRKVLPTFAGGDRGEQGAALRGPGREDRADLPGRLEASAWTRCPEQTEAVLRGPTV